ncbi:MAG TPA: hypothetical protein VK041_02945 [Opitutales bacterium]|nr:hypothetical protein [Opitutales bacterium]
MIFTRKIGKIFRGKATPGQLMMAALIGTTAGFVPGLLQAPGLVIFLFFAAVILNANLALMGICLLVSALLSILLLPLTFKIGQFLLDGPLEGFFATLVNAPVLAYFGFEYYVTVGGLVLGILFGILFGWATIRAVQGFRRKMGHLDQNSPKWKKFQKNPLIRIFTFVFIGGGHGKLTYEELLEKKGGPVRPLGIVLVVLLGVFGFVVSLFLSDSIVRYAFQSGLERANGATVDLENAELKLTEGRLTLSGLALADPNELSTDLFRAEKLEASISQKDLLRKRMHIENLQIIDAATGEKRQLPGVLTRSLPEPPPEEPGEGKSLDDYIQEAKKWRERLNQLAEWVEKVSGPEKEPEEEITPESEEERQRRILQDGYRRAVASHLIEKSPTLLISYASAEKMRMTQFPDETVDVIAENFSTHPRLVEEPPRIMIRSSEDSFLVDADLAGLSGRSAANSLEFVYLGLPVDQVADGLKFSGQTPIQGGTIDLRSRGTWQISNLNLPIEVTLRNTQLSIPEIGDTAIEELLLPIGIGGSLRSPRIGFTNEDFTDALAKAGKAELSRRLQSETDKLRGKIEEKAEEAVGDRARDLLDGVFRNR